MNTLFWLENSLVGMTVSSTHWGYPIVLSLHAIGMATLVGVSLMLTIRGLGFASAIPLRSLAVYWRVALCGFALNLVSGSALFCGAASELFFIVAFRVKLVMVFAGLTLTWWLVRICFKRTSEMSRAQRGLSALAMVVWICAIIFGRLIGYWS